METHAGGWGGRAYFFGVGLRSASATNISVKSGLPAASTKETAPADGGRAGAFGTLSCRVQARHDREP